MKQRLLHAVGLDGEHVRVPRYRAADLRMVPNRDGSHLGPLAFECPTCAERDGADTRLLMVRFWTTARHTWLHRDEGGHVVMLLSVARD